MIKNLTSVGAAPSPPKTKKAGQKHYRVSEADLPELSFAGQLIRSADQLEPLLEPWRRLLDVSIRPNSFFDPDFLIPAIRHLGDANVSVLVIDAAQRVDPLGPRVICGLLPVIKKKFYGIPINCLEIWKHDQCFDSTPLIRYDCATEVLEFIFEFLAEEMNTNLISMNTVAGEGAIANLLTDNFYRNSRTVFHRDEFTRSCFRPMCDGETYIKTKVSKNTRKGTRRLSRKLAFQGELVTEVSTDCSNQWIEEFLNLESAGWKGQTGTSIASDQATRQFFCEMTSRMLNSNRLIISRTSFDDRPISMFVDLIHQGRGAHFKTTFDESFGEYSPGLIAELANIHRLHQSNIEFVDSCADPDHSMINRVWPDRVRFQSLVIAIRGPISRLAVSTFPLMQFLSCIFKWKK